MVKSKLFFFAVLAALLGGCTNETAEVSTHEAQVHLVANINGYSRSPQLGDDGSGQFSEGDVLGVAVSGDNGQFQTLEFPYASRLYWEDIKLTGANDTKVKFVGYYPLLEGISTETKAVLFDVSKASEKDLLLASACEVPFLSQNEVSLCFSHAMHRLSISYKSSDGTYSEEELKTISTECIAKAVCTVNLQEGTLSSSAVEKSTYPAVVGKQAEIYIVPQSKKEVSLKVTVNGRSKELLLSSVSVPGMNGDMLESGKVLNLELDVRRNGVFISGGSISGWDTQGSASGTIIL